MLAQLANWNQARRDAWVADQARSVPAGSRVLDVGAGGCPYRSLFAHCRYESQDAAPLSPDQLRQGSYGQIDHVCDAASMPLPDASFDVVLCTEVLEHVPEPIAVVRELGRVLRPGGLLLLTAPLGSGLHQAPHHYYGGYTPWWHERFLGEAGFEAIEVAPNEGSLSHFAQWCCWTVARLWRAVKEGDLLLAPLVPFAAAALLPSAAVARAIDRRVGDVDFTVGYFVRARRRGQAGAGGAPSPAGGPP